PQQPDYLNAVVEIETYLEAEKLLEVCSCIEQDMGRIRRVHWGPRVIDIDILLFGELILNTEQLTVPHPRMHERAFVLKPLADISPDYIHPVLGLTVGEILVKIDEAGVRKMMNVEL
ncbi:MAG TPA: 2-amino-4-hydroxy-6-hydroxymethyldihydropteridine diphosphokinase, partial [Anaerolineae bacterium]|nr:2-amino-4-hydroxy-6-hydroxymethyldihydropteridine diphosphokinase [Anaerolineae bacterium]